MGGAAVQREEGRDAAEAAARQQVSDQRQVRTRGPRADAATRASAQDGKFDILRLNAQPINCLCYSTSLNSFE